MPAPIEPAAPPILYGTAWKRERTAALVERALTLGFRGVDTACQPKHYDEPGVGRGVAAFLARGGSRERLYLQTKFTPRRARPEAHALRSQRAARRAGRAIVSRRWRARTSPISTTSCIVGTSFARGISRTCSRSCTTLIPDTEFTLGRLQ